MSPGGGLVASCLWEVLQKSESGSPPGSFQMTASMLELGVCEILCMPFKSGISIFTALQLSSTQVPLAFKARCFRGLSFLCRTPRLGAPKVRHRPLAPWGEPLQMSLSSHLCITYVGVWVLIILPLCLYYPFYCSFFFISLILEHLFC